MAKTEHMTEEEQLFESLEAEEMDHLRSVIASVLIEQTDFDLDTIYSLVFREGRRIIWS
ncbi:MAG: hypothetical protein PVG55_00770 [Nitrospirota bacterium]|jgi:hypothetical protein